MGVLGPAAFERSLRRLDSRTFTSFVAAMYEARGTEATVEGASVVLADGRTIECFHRRRLRSGIVASRAIPEGTDVVVSSGASDRLRARALDRGASYVGPQRLHSFLLYGLDRVDADSLCREYLGRPLAASGDEADRRSRALAIGLGILLVVAAAVTVLGAPAVLPGGDDRSPGRVETTGGVDDSTAQSGAKTTPGGSTTESVQYPPGVGSGGVQSASALASAHRSIVRNRSYQILVLGRGDVSPVGPWPPEASLYGKPWPPEASLRWSSFRQRITVERPTVYRSRLTGLLANDSGGDLVVYDDYADGAATYRRYGGTASPKYVQMAHRDDLVAGAASSYVLQYLSTNATRVERLDANRFRIVATGDPRMIFGEVSNYTAVAIVSRAGFVSSLAVSFDRPAPADGAGNRQEATPSREPDSRETTFQFQYSELNRTDVPRPAWYDTARRAVGTAATPAGIQLDSGSDGGRNGTVDAVALAETHGAAVRNQSYEWNVSQQRASSVGFVDGPWEHVRRRAVVANASRYTYRLVGARGGGAGRFPIIFDLYADGSYRYQRSNANSDNLSTATYRRARLAVQPQDPFADLAERYVRRYLATTDVRVTIAETKDSQQSAYRVVATGRPTRIERQLSDYRAVANVTAGGLVRSLRVSYLRPGFWGEQLVTVSYEYDRVGNATVEPPAWYDEARAATGSD